MRAKPLSSTSCKCHELSHEHLGMLTFMAYGFHHLIFPPLSLMKEVVHTSPTIGSNVEEIVVKNTHFLMWDIGGQESLRSSWNTYYSNTEVRATAGHFSTLWRWRPARYCLASERASILAAGVFVQSADGQQGPPMSEVSLWQRSQSERQSRGRPPQCRCRGGGEQMCKSSAATNWARLHHFHTLTRRTCGLECLCISGHQFTHVHVENFQPNLFFVFSFVSKYFCLHYLIEKGSYIHHFIAPVFFCYTKCINTLSNANQPVIQRKL